MCGRGMRVHAAKTDCLVLDYVGNIETHGPVTHVEPPPPPREGGDRENSPSVKECPECTSALLYLAATVCDECGYEFPKKYKVQSRAASANIMAKVDIREHQVTGYKAVVHTKRNAPDMIKITWKSGMLPICDQYLCINHQGYARQKAVEWFTRWTGRLPTGDMNVDLETLNNMPEPPVFAEGGSRRQVPRDKELDMSDVPREHCDMCGEEMDSIFSASDGMKLKGWCCYGCRNWREAILRERRYEWSPEWDEPAPKTHSVGH